jgi:hypothetical protein
MPHYGSVALPDDAQFDTAPTPQRTKGSRTVPLVTAVVLSACGIAATVAQTRGTPMAAVTRLEGSLAALTSANWTYWDPTGSNDDGSGEWLTKHNTQKCADTELDVEVSTCASQDEQAFDSTWKYEFDVVCPSGSPCSKYCSTAQVEGWTAPCMWQMVANLGSVCNGTFNATMPSRRRQRRELVASEPSWPAAGRQLKPGGNSACSFGSFCMYCNASNIDNTTAHVCDEVANTGCNFTTWDFAALPTCLLGAKSAYAEFSAERLNGMCETYYDTPLVGYSKYY